MYGVIASAHGVCASGVNSGLELVCGAMENIVVVDFIEGDSAEDLDQALQKAYESLSDYKKKIFITDLMGGTPFNRAVLNFSNNPNVRVLSGLNFPLLYHASIIEASDNMDADMEEIIKEAREGMEMYRTPVIQEQDIEEDGI